MKKIFCLLGFLMAFNVFAQLNMNAVFSGQTNNVVCYLYSEPGNGIFARSVGCGNKQGPTGNLPLKMETQRVIADFVGSGVWNLAATFLGAQNTTIFVFTKR